jgi:putative phosphoesterase
MTQQPVRIVIGLISDTHGILRPSVHRAFEGVDLILHAGDVGGGEILDELRLIAPVQAVCGNTDPADDPNLEESLSLQLGGLDLHVSHGHELGSPTPAKLVAAHPHRVIVYGHTHRQIISRVGGQLVINPGAAGARRFDLAPSVARLTIENGEAEVEIVPLD